MKIQRLFLFMRLSADEECDRTMNFDGIMSKQTEENTLNLWLFFHFFQHNIKF